MPTFPPSDRSRLRRVAKRGHYDTDTIYRVLDAGYLAHVAFVQDGGPLNIPMLYGRVGEQLYLHASTKSRFYQHLASGVPVCLTVTHVDGLVLARSAFHHSVNYRSVVLHGRCTAVADETDKNEALHAFTDHMVADRWAEIRQPSPKELQVTGVLAFEIEEATAKIRTGGPVDDAEDYALPIWAGVVPYHIQFATPIADEKATSPLPLPKSGEQLMKK